jgi:hypothetical protein
MLIEFGCVRASSSPEWEDGTSCVVARALLARAAKWPAPELRFRLGGGSAFNLVLGKLPRNP